MKQQEKNLETVSDARSARSRMASKKQGAKRRKNQSFGEKVAWILLLPFLYLYRFICVIGKMERRLLAKLFGRARRSLRVFYARNVAPRVNRWLGEPVRYDYSRMLEGEIGEPHESTPELIKRKFKLLFIRFITGYHASEIPYPITEEHRAHYKKVAVGRFVTYMSPVVAMILVVMLVMSAKDYTMGVKVVVDGAEVASLESAEAYKVVAARVEKYIGSITGQAYSLGVEPRFQSALINKKSAGDSAELENFLISTASDVLTNAYGLYIDGELIAANADRGELDSIVNTLLDAAKTGTEGERVEFIQDVSIREELLPKKSLRSQDETMILLNQTVTQERVHKVKSSDLMVNIATEYNMSLASLQTLNPDVDPKRLTPGMDLVVEKEAVMVSVKNVRTITYEESIAYSTVTESTDSLYTNQRKVSKKGVTGTALVTADVITIDGMEVSSVQTGYTVIAEPVTEVVLKGTKPLPAKSPTGSFMRPIVGATISSSFGRRGGSNHTGVDFATKSGTSIMAADGGKVIFSGWSGNYGKLVKIDHGNGFVTYYAHCSSLLVSVGQSVAKGEVIAKVGSTGRSTGPHLHFEVRISGTAVNPMNYIK